MDKEVSVHSPLGYCRPATHPKVLIAVLLLLQVSTVVLLLLQANNLFLDIFVAITIFVVWKIVMSFIIVELVVCGNAFVLVTNVLNDLFVVDVYNNLGYPNTHVVVVHLVVREKKNAALVVSWSPPLLYCLVVVAVTCRSEMTSQSCHATL